MTAKVRVPIPGRPGHFMMVDAAVDRSRPCVSLGGPTGHELPCTTCTGTVPVALRGCSRFGVCTTEKIVKLEDGAPVKSCGSCEQYEARPAPGKVAPLETAFHGEGRRPWEYSVTVAIPHLNTLDQIRLAVEMWRAQTVRPFIQIVDTGSPAALLPELEKLRAEDVEIHLIRAHAYTHSSAPVTVALDLSQSLCRTRHLFHTHADVFPIRRDFLAWMLAQTTAETPVVGWQMSPRTGDGSRYWAKCVSHTGTMLHAQTMRQKALWWTMERHYDEHPEDRHTTIGWPDTESPFLWAMNAAGITPKLLGTEENFQRHTLFADGVAWADHARSFTGLKMSGAHELKAASEKYMADAERDARARLAEWKGQP